VTVAGAGFPGWVTPEQGALLEQHLALLTRWNRTINLIRFRNREEAIARHYNEALFLARRLPARSLVVADIGSGAGFPGFAVAVVRPDCAVTLIESHQRKAAFLREASRGLANVQVFAGRAEDWGLYCDWAISRAVSYRDLERVLGHVAANAALLTGEEGPPSSLGFVWDEAVRLPGADRRFLRMGHRLPG
jgi:16S rRNA (guanine(527)-N(7))-methyltransferase RsmG